MPDRKSDRVRGWNILSPLWAWVTLPPALLSVLLGLLLLEPQRHETLPIIISCLLGIIPIVPFEIYRRDVRGRADAERALLESEKQYLRSLELSSNGIAIYQDERIVFINPAGARLLGAASPGELLGRPVVDFVRPEYRAHIENRLHEVSENRGADDL